jgi:hypothetical protein
MASEQKIPGTVATNSDYDRQPLANGGTSADQQVKIRDRALELAQARGQQEGYSEEDWRFAEEEILHITGGG